MNYDNRVFRGRTNSDNGEVGEATRFHYHQSGDQVWADYSGGGIVKGHLQEKFCQMVVWNSCITMRTSMVSLWLVGVGRLPNRASMGKSFSKKAGNGLPEISRKVCLKLRSSATISNKRFKSFATLTHWDRLKTAL